MKDHCEEGAEQRDFEQEISDEKSAAVEGGQTVPERVQDHRAEITDDGSGFLQSRFVSLARDADPDARHASEQDVGIRGEDAARSEEHTSELQSLTNLVCRLLLEKKKT